MHYTSSWACSPYLCAQNFNWSLIDPFPLSYLFLISSSPPITYFFISLPLFHDLCTLISPPLSSITTKVQRVGNTICRVEIINVNQWDEDHFPKFCPIQIIYQRYLAQFDPRTSFFTPPNKGYLVPCWVKYLKLIF